MSVLLCDLEILEKRSIISFGLYKMSWRMYIDINPVNHSCSQPRRSVVHDLSALEIVTDKVLEILKGF